MPFALNFADEKTNEQERRKRVNAFVQLNRFFQHKGGKDFRFYPCTTIPLYLVSLHHLLPSKKKNYYIFQKKQSIQKKLYLCTSVFVAQLVEQLTLNQWVQGSSPCEDTDISQKSLLTLSAGF